MPKNKNIETRNINDMQLRAAFVPSTVNDEDRSVEVTFGTETPYLRYGWDGPYNEILSFDAAHVRMDRLNSGAAPLLDNHDRWGGTRSVLGVVEKAWIEGKEGRAIVRFSKNSDEAERVFEDVKDGILKGISVGYRVYKYEEQEKQGAPAGVKKDETPNYRATDWEPMEISVAPVPADYKSVVRSENDSYQVTIIKHNDDTMKTREQIIALLQQRGISIDQNATDEELLATLERAMTATPPAPAPTPAPAAGGETRSAEEITAAERKRTAEIRTLCRAANVDDATTDKYINEGTSLEAVRTAVLEKFMASDENKGSRANVSVGADKETDARRNAMVDAIILRSGAIAGYKPTMEMNVVQEYRHMKLVDLAKRSLDVLGVDYRGMNEMEIVKRAITSSSSDFPVLLEGTNRRILLAAYESIADTWRAFCSIGSVSDFRDYKRVKLGSMFARLDQVNENGEYKNKAIKDGTQESISVDTYGNTINVTRKMIINDDLGGFTRLAALLGRAAARSIETDVYAALAENSGAGPIMADGNPLFHASHNNISTAAALSMDALEADRVKMALQKDLDGNDFLDLRPSVLLLPIGLGAAARTYNDAAYDPDSTGKFQKPNTVRGLFNQIVDTPRLSGTRRYLFADPNVAPVLEVAFLNGVQTPYMESEETFDVDGMRWKIRLDYGVAPIDWQGAVTNAGA